MTCDDLAKKCKAGDKEACELYKEKCGKVIFHIVTFDFWQTPYSVYHTLQLFNDNIIPQITG